MILLWLSAAALAAEETQEDAQWSWYAVPNVSYDSDDGFGLGARAEWNKLAEGLTPYQTAWVIQLFATTTGYHHHRVRFDRLGLGADGQWRVTVHAAWRQWKNDGYWGIGNGTLRESDDARHRYSLIQPFSHAVLQRTLAPSWRGFVSLNIRHSTVEAYPGTLLAEQQPYGMDGGLTVQGMTGLIRDTRDNPANPGSGTYAEVSGRQAVGSAGVFGGPFASVIGFVSPTERLTAGARLMGERLWGQVPFYEQVHWGGCWPVAGFGGAETLRGVRFGRWRAPGKAVLNTELRTTVIQHNLKGSTMAWELVPYVDVGTVFGAEDADAPPPAQPLHYALGGGLRVIYDDRFVGRLDMGAGPDPIAGSDSADWETGFYLVFDHTF